jgi:hypothetical protein
MMRPKISVAEIKNGIGVGRPSVQAAAMKGRS